MKEIFIILSKILINIFDLLLNFYAKPLFFALLGSIIGAVVTLMTLYFIFWRFQIEKTVKKITSCIEEDAARITSNITAYMTQTRADMAAIAEESKTIRGEITTVQKVLQDVGRRLEIELQQNNMLRKKLDTTRKRLQQLEERQNNDQQ